VGVQTFHTLRPFIDLPPVRHSPFRSFLVNLTINASWGHVPSSASGPRPTPQFLWSSYGTFPPGHTTIMSAHSCPFFSPGLRHSYKWPPPIFPSIQFFSVSWRTVHVAGSLPLNVPCCQPPTLRFPTSFPSFTRHVAPHTKCLSSSLTSFSSIGLLLVCF